MSLTMTKQALVEVGYGSNINLLSSDHTFRTQNI